ncbi:hypothetical protein E2C01_069952 [Portunus trituberculatus]|uniref:Uncharacterized protein n=1 Tax=Portunus trituberculatus TaxID=210409 RepID=A0A5B7HVX0_PORTR|nr:hypothetical protein [Portunus trituberculatus]
MTPARSSMPHFSVRDSYHVETPGRRRLLLLLDQLSPARPDAAPLLYIDPWIAPKVTAWPPRRALMADKCNSARELAQNTRLCGNETSVMAEAPCRSPPPKHICQNHVPSAISWRCDVSIRQPGGRPGTAAVTGRGRPQPSQL